MHHQGQISPGASWTGEPSATVCSGHGPQAAGTAGCAGCEKPNRERQLPGAEPKERAWGMAATGTSESSAAQGGLV